MDETKSLLVSRFLEEITERFKIISKIFKEDANNNNNNDTDNNQILKHMAAAAIHISIFWEQFIGYLNNDIEFDEESKRKIDKFTNECGCDFKGKS